MTKTLKIPFYRHDLVPEDAQAVAAVLATPFLTSGSVGKEVEAQIAAYHDVPYALLTNSWTNGALAVLLAMDIGPGDEVIVPAMTFVATANVVTLLGATPVFVDVAPATLLMQPEAVAGALSTRTRAVIPVHIYGQMCDIAGMRAVLSDRPEVRIIEDCAHCFEGTRDGLRPGARSDAAVFSFYATKNVACGEGGAIICRDQDLYERMRATRLHGMDVAAINRYQMNNYRHWDMVCMGVKANLPDLLAALLPRQIETVDERLAARRDLAARYRESLADGPLRLVAEAPGVEGAEHMFTVGVGGGMRDAAIAALNEAGIGVGVHYRSVPLTAFYAERLKYTSQAHPVSSAWGETTLTLPLYASMTREELEFVVAAVRRTVYPLLASVGK